MVQPRRRTQVYHTLGMLNHYQGDLSSAHRYYEDTLASNLPFISFSCAVKLGILCLEEEEIESAQQYLKRGIALCQARLEKTPRLYDVRYHLALAQLAIGKADDALTTYRQALEICSAKGVIESARQDLQSLQRAAQPVEGVERVLLLLEKAGCGGCPRVCVETV